MPEPRSVVVLPAVSCDAGRDCTYYQEVQVQCENENGASSAAAEQVPVGEVVLLQVGHLDLFCTN